MGLSIGLHPSIPISLNRFESIFALGQKIPILGYATSIKEIFKPSQILNLKFKPNMTLNFQFHHGYFLSQLYCIHRQLQLLLYLETSF